MARCGNPKFLPVRASCGAKFFHSTLSPDFDCFMNKTFFFSLFRLLIDFYGVGRARYGGEQHTQNSLN